MVVATCRRRRACLQLGVVQTWRTSGLHINVKLSTTNLNQFELVTVAVCAARKGLKTRCPEVLQVACYICCLRCRLLLWQLLPAKCFDVYRNTFGLPLLADQALQFWCAKCPAAAVALCCLALCAAHTVSTVTSVTHCATPLQPHRQLLRACS